MSTGAWIRMALGANIIHFMDSYFRLWQYNPHLFLRYCDFVFVSLLKSSRNFQPLNP